MALMGVDLGSSSCKAVVFDESGTVLSSAQKAFPAIFDGNHVEMDPRVTFNAFAKAVNEASSGSKDGIRALAIASHGESYLPVDAVCKPVGNIILNMDNRAIRQSEKLEREFGAESIYYETGAPIHPMFALTKIMWQKEHGIKASRFISVADYIAGELGLGTITDYSLASRFMGFDVSCKKWSERLLDAASIDKNQLPVPVQASTPVGELSAKAASLLGLSKGAIVCAGGHDQPVGALGAGITESGKASISAGSYECIAVASDKPMCTEKAFEYKFNSYCHVVPGKYITLAFSPGAMVVQWFVEQLCALDVKIAEEAGVSVYEYLNEKASAVRHPTGISITPHLVGSNNPKWDVRATTVIAGLTPSVTRYAIYKAIFEGIASELALNTKALEEVTGEIERFRISGGGARYPFSVELRAALTGRTIEHLTTSEAVCLGAAMLAGLGAGVFKDFTQATGNMVHVASGIRPDPELAAEYGTQTKRYSALFDGLETYRGIN